MSVSNQIILILSVAGLILTSQFAAKAETEQKATTTTASSTTESTKSNAQDVTAAKTTVKVKEDLPNFHEVHPFLYRGGEPNERGLEKLKEMGIATIIDLRAPSEMKIDESLEAKKLGMRYIDLVMDSHAPTEKQVSQMMNEIDKAKELDEKGEKDKKVFIHCAHGSDRTGCMIGIWRVTREGWDYPTAYKEMRKYWFTPKFIRLSGAVEEYANSAAKKTSSTSAGSSDKSP